MPLARSPLSKAGESVVRMKDRDPIKTFLESARRKIVARKIRLCDFFRDFDRTRSGRITKGQFRRGLMASGVYASEEQIRALSNEFQDEFGEFLYGKFCDVVDSVFKTKGLETTPQVDPESKAHLSGRADFGGDLNEDEKSRLDLLLKMLAKKVKNNRILTKVYFKDFDVHKYGYITETRFRRALFPCFAMSFTESDLALLCKAFQMRDVEDTRVKYVNYCDFLGLIDPTGAPGGMRHSEERKSNGQTFVQIKKYVSKVSELDPDRVEADVLKEIVSKNMPIKGAFRDFDPLRTGFCTRDQFSRSLVMCGLSNAGNDVLRTMCNRYFDTQVGKVNYNRFVDIVTEALQRRSERLFSEQTAMLVSAKEKTSTSSSSSSSSSPTSTTIDVSDTLRKIKVICKRRRIRLREFMSDFDKLRRGHITRSQLEKGLCAAGLQISSQELAALSDAYVLLSLFFSLFLTHVHKINTHPNINRRYPATLLDVRGLKTVSWTKFCSDVESVFTIQSLESNPMTDVNSLIRQAREGIESSGDQVLGLETMRSEQKDELEALLKQIVKLKKSMFLNDFSRYFKDFDRSRSGIVTLPQFERAMKMVRIQSLTSRDLALLGQAFKVHISGTSCVKYKAFIACLDRVEQGCSKGKIWEVTLRRSSLESVSSKEDQGTGRRPKNRGSLGGATSGSLNQILDEMSLFAKKNCVRLKDFLHDYDTLRKGFITKAKLRTALSSAGFSLSSGDMRLLESKFQHKDPVYNDMVDYRELIRLIDPYRRE